MCLLVVKPANIELPSNLEEICEQAYEHNQDGVGFCTPTIYWRDIKVAPKSFAKTLRSKISYRDAAIIHWRFGTSGGTRRGNCHPFHLPDGTMFAHNGVIDHVYHPTETESDTLILAKNSSCYDELVMRCGYLVDQTNKFAIMRKGENKVEILGESFGNWMYDMWFSNTYWQNKPKQYYHLTGNYYVSEDQLDDLIRLEMELQPLVDTFGFDAVEQTLRLMRLSV